MENVYLKPAPADGGGVVLVRDPASLKPLDAAGEWKPGNQYWTRRIRDKDVVVSSPPAATAVASAPAAPAPAPAEPIAASEPAAFTNCVTCPEPSVCRVRATCLHPHAPN
ncbi:DUF2635 domain-containing protein [Bradyrhizobium sp. BTAi1]|uniref:DUF2635 domain-containing protein n=1 Tax=Bradyrhizobium sp. (strain BTAi1 / ATCC BAA-1182) TaxID=288000 RepID=UPI00005E0AF6|nr:DUF2635 domain-containing protein [Bradyrhizobium sp. BTAi1]ABQ38496.1 hypothetical protein BBta_6593 [Bradyrhizobium sp. BTAi1]